MGARLGATGANRLKQSCLEKRSLRVSGVRTSIALEPAFWAVLEQIAKAERISVRELIDKIVATSKAKDRSLASCVRVYALVFRPD